jgi:hypothetical protein
MNHLLFGERTPKHPYHANSILNKTAPLDMLFCHYKLSVDDNMFSELNVWATLSLHQDGHVEKWLAIQCRQLCILHVTRAFSSDW